MKITIQGNPKEITALVLAVQEQQDKQELEKRVERVENLTAARLKAEIDSMVELGCSEKAIGRILQTIRSGHEESLHWYNELIRSSQS